MKKKALNKIEDIIRCVEANVGKVVGDEIEVELSWKGRFAATCYPELIVFAYSNEKKQALMNTLEVILNDFENIYMHMLEAMYPTLVEWEFGKINGCGEEIGEAIQSLEDLHSARCLDFDFIPTIKINCKDIEEGYCYYSFLFVVDCGRYGFDDGMEVVCYKNQVVFWADGNTMEHLFDFRDYQ